MDNFLHGDESELLIDYLDGSLDEAQRSGVEIRLKSEPLLQEELDNLVLAREAIRQHGIGETVARVHKKMVPEQAPIRKLPARTKITRFVGAAAAVLLLVVAGYFFLTNDHPTPQKVYDGLYEPYALSTARGEGDSSELDRKYRDGQFADVIQIYNTKDKSTKSAFLAGASEMQLQNFQAAIMKFWVVLNNNKNSDRPVMNDDAEYYLALAYIQEHEYESALSLLRKIQEDPGHTYHSRVSEKIIREVEQLK